MRIPYVIYGALNSLNILSPRVTVIANSSHFESAFSMIHLNLGIFFPSWHVKNVKISSLLL